MVRWKSQEALVCDSFDHICIKVSTTLRKRKKYIYICIYLYTCFSGTNTHLARHSGSSATLSDASNTFFSSETVQHARILGYFKLQSDWLLPSFETPPTRGDVILLRHFSSNTYTTSLMSLLPMKSKLPEYYIFRIM